MDDDCLLTIKIEGHAGAAFIWCMCNVFASLRECFGLFTSEYECVTFH